MQKGKMWLRKCGVSRKIWKSNLLALTMLCNCFALLCLSPGHAEQIAEELKDSLLWNFKHKFMYPHIELKALYAPVVSAERCVQNCLYHWWEREKKKCADESNAVLHLSWKRWLVLEYRSQNVEKIWINAIKN